MRDAAAVMQVTDDITDLSYASVFSSVGKQTPVIVRFSIVSASLGSPEWIRDPRGFAVKFYAGSPQGGPTQGCIWDLVGNNFPVHCAAPSLMKGCMSSVMLGGISLSWA